jgi:hypothetical protein
MYNLIICIFACDTIQTYRNEIIKINETWGKKIKDNIKLLFFLGEEKTDLIGDNYINLKGVKNDYLSALYKQFLGLKYIYEMYNPNFVFCCGTDTYINIDKLVNYIINFNFNPNSNFYIGGHGDFRQIGYKNIYFHSGGAGFLLTNGCLDKLYPILENACDKWITICTINNIKYLETACDVAIAYYLQTETNTTILIDNVSFLNCNHKGMVGLYSCHPYIEIDKIITCHNMSSFDFDELYNYLSAN